MNERDDNFFKWSQNTWWRNLINFGAATISLAINFIIIGILGKGIPDLYFWFMTGSIIILISGLFFASWYVIARHIERTQFIDTREWANRKRCDSLDRFCCGDSVCRSLSQNSIVNPNKDVVERLTKEHSIFLQPHILSLEEEFYKKNGKEIMIVSSSLDSEVSLEGVKGASNLVKDNLKNGIKYSYYYD